MGVPYHVFWEDDADMVEVYLEKYRLDRERFNEDAWIQGIYTNIAMSTVMANAFRKKHDKEVQYVNEPLELFKTQEDEDREKNSRKLYEQFKSVMGHFNNKKIQEKNKRRFLKE